MEAYGLRDRIACAVCNWIMRHIASTQYRKTIDGAVSYGLASAVRDDREGREAPKNRANDLTTDRQTRSLGRD